MRVDDEYYWTAIFIHQYLNDVLDGSTYIYIRLITLFATYLSILVLVLVLVLRYTVRT
jgi:hypothetical protein